jgi:hypothetical protein
MDSKRVPVAEPHMSVPASDILTKVLPTALTGIGGYFVGIFQTRNRKRRMRKQLYREMSRNYQNVVVHIARCSSITGLSEGALLRFADKLDISFDVWNFYNDEKRKELLFELKEADTISRIYGKFGRTGIDLGGYPHVRAKEVAAEVDDSLLDGSLDRKLYERASSKEAWRFMVDLLSGERKSYGEYLNPLDRPIR